MSDAIRYLPIKIQFFDEILNTLLLYQIGMRRYSFSIQARKITEHQEIIINEITYQVIQITI